MVQLPDLSAKLRLDTTEFNTGVSTATEKTSGLGGILKTGLGVAAGFAGVKLVEMGGFALKTGIQTASAMQQATISFTTLLGSATQAKSFLAGLATFAAHTPYDMPGLVDAARQLLGVGQRAQDVIPDLSALGNATSALGLSQDRFQHIMLAVTQSMGAGKLQAGDLLQITEAGLPIWSLLSQALGKPVTELRNLSSQGKLMANDVWPKVFAQMNKNYGGAMEAQSKSLAGVWSTLTDTVSQSLAKAFQPMIPMLSTLVPKAADFAGNAISGLGHGLADVGRFLLSFKDEATGLVNGLRGISSGSGFASMAFNDLGKAINFVVKAGIAIVGFLISIKGWLMPVVAGVLAVVGAMKLWALGQAALTAIQTIATLATDGFAAAQLALEAVMAVNPFVLIILAVVALVAIFVVAWKNSETFRDVIKGVLSAVGNFFKGLWKDVKPVLDVIISAMKIFWAVMKVEWEIGVKVVSFVFKMFEGYYNAILKPILSIIISAIKIWWTLIKAEFEIGSAIIAAAFHIWMDAYNVTLKPVLDFIIGAIKVWWGLITTEFSIGVGVIRTVFGFLVDLWSATLGPIFDFIAAAVTLWWNGMKLEFNAGVAIVKAVWGALSWLFDFISGVLNGVASVVHNFQASFTETVQTVVNVAKAIFSWFGNLGSMFSGWFNGALNAATGALNTLVGWLSGLGGRVLSALGNMGSLLFNIGKDIINGLVHGIENAADAVGRAVLNLVNKIPGPIKKIMGIASPSKVMMALGEFIGQGLAIGMDNTQGLIAQSAAGLAGMVSINPALATAGAYGSSSSASTTHNYAPTINAYSNADPHDIANEIAWNYKYRGARS